MASSKTPNLNRADVNCWEVDSPGWDCFCGSGFFCFKQQILGFKNDLQRVKTIYNWLPPPKKKRQRFFWAPKGKGHSSSKPFLLAFKRSTCSIPANGLTTTQVGVKIYDFLYHHPHLHVTL